MPQVPTARGIKIRSASDAHLLFYAVHLRLLPIIHRRLDATERLEVTSGAVFVWEERSASTSAEKLEPDAGPGAGIISGIERWTDGLKWGPSRVRDDFLFYQEKDSSGDSILTPTQFSHTHPYRKSLAKPADLLVKQTYSVHYNPQVLEGKPPVEPARKWHLTAYQSAGSADRLSDVSSVPELQGIVPPEGLFRKARIGKKREGPSEPRSNSNSNATPTMGSSMYPLESYGSVHNGVNGTSHRHRGGDHSASASFDMGTEHGREGSMASSSWREDSTNEMGLPHRHLTPQHPPQGLGQNGYSERTGLPPSSPYPPSHNGHVPPANGYNGAPYPSHQSHYTPPHEEAHSAPHHSHAGSIGYSEQHSPYTQTHHNAGQMHGGGYGAVPAGYPYPREIGYGHPAEGEYNRGPTTQESPSANPVMGGHLQTPLQHNQPLHHPPSGANGQNTYSAYHPSDPASQQQQHPHPHHHQQQQHALNPPPQHHDGAPIQPTQDATGHLRQAHHSYSYSNGHPLPNSHQVTPHIQNHGVDSRHYAHTPGPIMSHSQSQNADLDHRRTFSQSSHPSVGAMEGMQSPPVGVARIRKGNRKSEDIANFHAVMSRSPPSGHVMNGSTAARPPGMGAIGGNGGRSQFSPYSRPADSPGPRQHTSIARHHQSETASTLPSFDHQYNPRGANGSFPHQAPDHHHYPPPVPPSLPPRPSITQGPGYYFSPSAIRNDGALTAGGAPPFVPHDYSRSNSGGTWTDAQPPPPPLRPTSLQTLSAYPVPAGPPPSLQNGSQQQITEMSSEVVVGIPAVPIGMTIHGHIPPHPNPHSSPLLTHFQLVSASLESSRSDGSSRGAGNGSPDLVGVHQHMAVPAGLASGWDGGGGTAHSETPAPPRVDSFLAGVETSPASVTAGGSASGSVSSKLGPLTPSTTLVTRDPEDERVLDLLSRGLLAAAGVRGNAEGAAVVAANGSTEEIAGKVNE